MPKVQSPEKVMKIKKSYCKATCPKMKMNDKKKPTGSDSTSQGARSLFDANLDFGDNPIYPISKTDGQDREVYTIDKIINIARYNLIDTKYHQMGF